MPMYRTWKLVSIAGLKTGHVDAENLVLLPTRKVISLSKCNAKFAESFLRKLPQIFAWTAFTIMKIWTECIKIIWKRRNARMIELRDFK